MNDPSEGKAGIPFRLAITVLDTTTCKPLSKALVDLWHCDAEGMYSHFIAASLGQFGGASDNSTFFRGRYYFSHLVFLNLSWLPSGQQVTDNQGVANFDTIYPGWYRGRATHIHVKVHVGSALTNVGGAVYAKGGHVSFTGQLFFDDTLTDQVAKLSPYTSHTIRRTRNDEDGIYSDAKGSTTIVPVQFLTPNNIGGGVKGAITLGINPSAVSTESGRPGRPGGPGGPRPPRPPSSRPPRPTTSAPGR